MHETMRDVPLDDLEIVDEAVAAYAAAFAAALEKAFAEFSDSLPVGVIAEAAASGSVSGIFDLSTSWDDLAASILSQYDDGGAVSSVILEAVRESAGRLPGGAALELIDLDDVDALALRARAWLNANGARLVTLVANNTKEAIVEILDAAFDGPESVKAAAKLIAEIKGLGLSRPQASAFARYVAGLQAQDPPLSAKRIKALAEKRYRKLIKQRALLIAQTEAVNAGNAGQGLAWRQAVREGVVDPAVYVMEWVTRFLRSCPRCEALDGATAEIEGGSFESLPVASGSWAGQTIVVVSPTVHPRCACGRRLIRRDEAIR